MQKALMAFIYLFHPTGLLTRNLALFCFHVSLDLIG